MESKSESPKYRIQKSYPGLPVGCLIQQQEPGGQYTLISHAPGNSLVWLPAQIVERNPEWFQLIEEPLYTKSDLLAFAASVISWGSAGNLVEFLEKWLKSNRNNKAL